MANRLDNKLKSLLDEHFNNIKNEGEKDAIQKLPGIFFIGILTGIIITYTGLINLLFGIIIGLFLRGYVDKSFHKIIDGFTGIIGQYITGTKLFNH